MGGYRLGLEIRVQRENVRFRQSNLFNNKNRLLMIYMNFNNNVRTTNKVRLCLTVLAEFFYNYCTFVKNCKMCHILGIRKLT